MNLTSEVFIEGGPIPKQYTCDQRGVSPPLSWSGEPEETAVFALIVDDPDAPRGDFIHWLLYNLPASVTSLPPGLPRVEKLDSGAVQGINGFGKIGYGAPCPPPGPPHRYRFTLYALEAAVGLEPGATAGALTRAMEGKVGAEARLTGLYQRAQ
ncbi:MAG: YbhB/YbcL family Raf kinase inhibitor-like protein [Chloroflexota bacterium]